MDRRVTITESEYRAIMQWEDDGGTPIDTFYEIIADRLLNQDAATAKAPVKSFATNDRLLRPVESRTKIA